MKNIFIILFVFTMIINTKAQVFEPSNKNHLQIYKIEKYDHATQATNLYYAIQYNRQGYKIEEDYWGEKNRYEYNNNLLLKQEKLNNQGKIVEMILYQYDTLMNNIEITCTTQGALKYKLINTYENNLKISEERYIPKEDTIVLSKETNYHYYPDRSLYGKQVKGENSYLKVLYNHKGEEQETVSLDDNHNILSRSVYKYDKEGNWIQTISFQKEHIISKVKVEYEINNISVRKYLVIQKGDVNKRILTLERTLDHNQKVIEETSFSEVDAEIEKKVIYKYHKNGTVSQKIEQLYSDEETVPGQESGQQPSSIVYKYNDKGLLISKVTSFESILYEYDNEMNLIREVSYIKDEPIFEFRYSYKFY